ncbi:type II toxin-antitoxin system HicB family antitoxin [Zhaonella formicivorans]|uniref:type II toxin-antitoxin system HicB family antitoxin n=1 Tax=Zhaonella formicivorans TaxID=2528593 RepID=UPI0010DB1DBA|nr:type II toxin-antitoxin system HicB family antitoxin [Zhaonella formicivorans]
MDKYIFPAIFEPSEDGGYCITFPDLPGCITEADTLEDAITMAKEALELHLWGMEDDNDEIPTPTAPEKITVSKGSFVVPIEAYMLPIREEMANKAIKKTLTIPKWLNDLAESKKINFSQTLQSALKQQLGIEPYPKRNVKKQP